GYSVDMEYPFYCIFMPFQVLYKSVHKYADIHNINILCDIEY
ncbi:MAG: hypothetical protein K0Q85_153, partial [Caproiciproducens sp.]|nr:hypothetical protein [Caproiciproducens sp.]